MTSPKTLFSQGLLFESNADSCHLAWLEPVGAPWSSLLSCRAVLWQGNIASEKAGDGQCDPVHLSTG